MKLVQGQGSPEEGACWMSAIAWYAGDKDWTDAPSCVDPLIRKYAIWLNDELPSDEKREEVIGPMIFDVVGTKLDGNHKERFEAWLEFAYKKVTEKSNQLCFTHHSVVYRAIVQAVYENPEFYPTVIPIEHPNDIEPKYDVKFLEDTSANFITSKHRNLSQVFPDDLAWVMAAKRYINEVEFQPSDYRSFIYHCINVAIIVAHESTGRGIFGDYTETQAEERCNSFLELMQSLIRASKPNRVPQVRKLEDIPAYSSTV